MRQNYHRNRSGAEAAFPKAGATLGPVPLRLRGVIVAKEKSPAFQFYPRDFLTDENVLAMGPYERGLYITLLSIAWLEGSIPSDFDKLSRILFVDREQLERSWPSLAPCFLEGDLGRLVNPRLERERRSQAKYRKQQSVKGLKSAAVRRSTTVQPRFNHGSTGGQPAPVQPEGNSSSSSSSSSSIEETPSPTPSPNGKGADPEYEELERLLAEGRDPTQHGWRMGMRSGKPWYAKKRSRRADVRRDN
jgi:uncharacterized protein YdaU (DUF1376 family)